MNPDEYNGDDIVVDFGAGRATVAQFLHVCRAYQGPEPHFLFSHDEDGRDEVFCRCLESPYVPEERMVAFLEALIAESPEVLTLTNRWGGIIHIALRHTTSRRVHLLLAVPGNTRLKGGNLCGTPLHDACEHDHVDPEVIHRLIDLDPDALICLDRRGAVPLHHALARDPTSTYVQRMIELRPKTILSRDFSGTTPVQMALITLRESEDRAAALRQLVAQHPRSVALSDTKVNRSNALTMACKYWANHPDLVRAVLDAHPPSLVVPQLGWWRDVNHHLPLELTVADDDLGGMGEELAAFVTQETLYMALAVVEYVLGASISPEAIGDPTRTDDWSTRILLRRERNAAANVAWFRGHVAGTLTDRFPDVPVARASGFSAAQSLHRRIGSANENGATIVALVRALFCHDQATELLLGDSCLLRTVIHCETVVDLYRLNRRGRYFRPGVVPHRPSAGNEDHSTSLAAKLHQVDLLVSLSTSCTVESTYLQFREVAHHALIVHGQRPSDVGLP